MLIFSEMTLRVSEVQSGLNPVVAETGHCEERSDEAIQPFRKAQGPEPVEGLDRHGALLAPRDDMKGRTAHHTAGEHSASAASAHFSRQVGSDPVRHFFPPD